MDDPIIDEFDDDGGEAEDDVRYGLTALGVSHLECRTFLGFGPCSAMRQNAAVASSQAPGRRRIRRARTQRTTSLFG